MKKADKKILDLAKESFGKNRITANSLRTFIEDEKEEGQDTEALVKLVGPRLNIDCSEAFDIPEDSTLKAGSAQSIEISTDYQKSGWNWGTGDYEAGGYRVHVTFCTIGNGVRTTTLYGDDSFKVLVKEAKRYSAKAEREIFLALDFKKILESFKNGRQAVAGSIFAQFAQEKNEQ